MSREKPKTYTTEFNVSAVKLANKERSPTKKLGYLVTQTKAEL